MLLNIFALGFLYFNNIIKYLNNKFNIIKEGVLNFKNNKRYLNDKSKEIKKCLNKKFNNILRYLNNKSKYSVVYLNEKFKDILEYLNDKINIIIEYLNDKMKSIIECLNNKSNNIEYLNNSNIIENFPNLNNLFNSIGLPDFYVNILIFLIYVYILCCLKKQINTKKKNQKKTLSVIEFWDYISHFYGVIAKIVCINYIIINNDTIPRDSKIILIVFCLLILFYIIVFVYNNMKYWFLNSIYTFQIMYILREILVLIYPDIGPYIYLNFTSTLFPTILEELGLWAIINFFDSNKNSNINNDIAISMAPLAYDYADDNPENYGEESSSRDEVLAAGIPNENSFARIFGVAPIPYWSWLKEVLRYSSEMKTLETWINEDDAVNKEDFWRIKESIMSKHFTYSAYNNIKSIARPFEDKTISSELYCMGFSKTNAFFVPLKQIGFFCGEGEKSIVSVFALKKDDSGLSVYNTVLTVQTEKGSRNFHDLKTTVEILNYKTDPQILVGTMYGSNIQKYDPSKIEQQALRLFVIPGKEDESPVNITEKIWSLTEETSRVLFNKYRIIVIYSNTFDINTKQITESKTLDLARLHEKYKVGVFHPNPNSNPSTPD